MNFYKLPAKLALFRARRPGNYAAAVPRVFLKAGTGAGEAGLVSARCVLLDKAANSRFILAAGGSKVLSKI